jgi:hypothetical protein
MHPLHEASWLSCWLTASSKCFHTSISVAAETGAFVMVARLSYESRGREVFPAVRLGGCHAARPSSANHLLSLKIPIYPRLWGITECGKILYMHTSS